MNPHDDDWLEQKLAPPPHHPGMDLLRERVLGETVKVLRRKRLWRRLALAAGFALCYLAGLFTWQWFNRAPADVPQPSLAERPAPPTPPEPGLASARDLEWQAIENRDGDFHFFREAGDRYLEEELDPLSAVRCYRQALDEGADGALTVSPDDTWLLMAIKHARKKEKDNATPGI